MKPRLFLLSLLLSTAAWSAESSMSSAALRARGQYLVEGIGLCADCHSPRDEKGQFVTAHWLRGAPIGFTPAVPMPVWAPVAPPIAGLPSMSAEDAVRFLMHGQRPDGSMPRPPMPAYRLTEDDARAMVAYLKSIGDAPVAGAAAP
jgi:mono/diheme cytochrome c family protein